MIVCRLAVLGAVVTALALPGVAFAQRSLADVLGTPATPEGQPKTYLEEVTLFAYVENSYTWNLGDTSRGRVNDLRYYDFDDGYTFNMQSSRSRRIPPSATRSATVWS